MIKFINNLLAVIDIWLIYIIKFTAIGSEKCTQQHSYSGLCNNVQRTGSVGYKSNTASQQLLNLDCIKFAAEWSSGPEAHFNSLMMTSSNGTTHGHKIIWRKVCYTPFKLRPCFFYNLMLILLYTLWNMLLLFSKNQCRQYSRINIVTLQAFTMKCYCFACLWTCITTTILYSWDTSIEFPLCHTRISINHSQRFKVYRVTQV